MDLERQGNILIIGHQAILRCIYAYFLNYSQEDLPYIKIPLHTVIELTPKAYGCDEKRFKVDIEAVDTHRPKPTKTQPIKTKVPTKQELSHGTTNGTTPLPGASGEIVNDMGNPILPISPQLWPSNGTTATPTPTPKKTSQLKQELSTFAL